MTIRSLGALLCTISTILFVAGGLTDHWVDSDNGHWGLWEICDESAVGNNTFNVSTTTATSLASGVSYSTTTIMNDGNEDDDEDEDDDDKCVAFKLTSVPAFLHIVRVLMILAGIVLGYGTLSGKTVRTHYPRLDTFVETHKAELCGLISCGSTLFCLFLFEDNYKGVREDIFTNSYLSWSFYLVRTSVSLYFPAAIFLMAPSIQEKYKQGCNCRGIFPDCSRCEAFRRVCIRMGFNKPDTTERRQSVDYEVNTPTPISGNQELSMQMSDIDLDVFTVTVRNDEGSLSDGSSYVLPRAPLNDLPQYEDLSPSEPSLPPPPSYADVISGGYLEFSSSGPAASSSSNVPPPPSYYSSNA